jgi:hypothetical protein
VAQCRGEGVKDHREECDGCFLRAADGVALLSVKQGEMSDRVW